VKSYWLAKIYVKKKSAMQKNVALPALSIFERALCQSLKKISVDPAFFYNSGDMD
jgi:hypothetical protein